MKFSRLSKQIVYRPRTLTPIGVQPCPQHNADFQRNVRNIKQHGWGHPWKPIGGQTARRFTTELHIDSFAK